MIGHFISLITTSILPSVTCSQTVPKDKMLNYNIYYFHIIIIIYLIYYKSVFPKWPNIGTVFRATVYLVLV
jgi:hypothetical protein